MKAQLNTVLASIVAIVIATAAASAQQAPTAPPTTPYGAPIGLEAAQNGSGATLVQDCPVATAGAGAAK